MSQGTLKITVNGARNLMAALQAAGYKGTAQLENLSVVNKNAAALHINLTNTALSAPATPLNGTPIGTGETSVEFRLADTPVDGGLVWLYSASAVDVIVTVSGYGI